MIKWLYGTSIKGYGFLLHLAAFFGNEKARKWIDGRKAWSNALLKAITPNTSWIWFHCASLGEFEQGRPLMEAYRKKYPDKKLLLTFFSPSGYEIRKNYPGADHVCYLPLDTAANAEKFLDIVQPEKVFFIKYEFWFNLLEAAVQRNIPVYLVAAIFRPGQWFLQPYAKHLASTLKKVTRFFVQDEGSKKILLDNGIQNVTLAGDTRFDRVIQIAENFSDINGIREWKGDNFLIVAGSTWLADEELLLDAFVQQSHSVKLILVPHETDESHLLQLKRLLEKKGLLQTAVFFSEQALPFDVSSSILIVDTIGLLSRLYRYADMAHIGGGFGVGIHNSLEAAVYGIPLSWGPNYRKFREANGLLEVGAAKAVSKSSTLSDYITGLRSNPEIRKQKGELAKAFVYQHHGASELILEYV